MLQSRAMALQFLLKGEIMERTKRMAALQKELSRQGLGVALIGYSRNIFYYTGTAQPSYLVVRPDQYNLYIRSGLDFALRDVFISQEQVKEERRLAKIAATFINLVPPVDRRIGVELDILTAEQFLEIEKLFPGCEFINISPLLLDQRKTKDASEIAAIRIACQAIHAGHEAVLATLRAGITELELAAAVENAHRLAGHEGIFFIRQPDFYESRPYHLRRKSFQDQRRRLHHHRRGSESCRSGRAFATGNQTG
jgi:Xaa-Pro aminopeptidase